MRADSGVPQELRQKRMGNQSGTMDAPHPHHDLGEFGGGIAAAGYHRNLMRLKVHFI
jgi:hypothetical protein